MILARLPALAWLLMKDAVLFELLHTLLGIA